MDATSTTAHITAKTATAAALTTSKSAATKPTPPNPNAPTADPLNIKADAALAAVTYYFEKTRFAKAISPFVMHLEILRRK